MYYVYIVQCRDASLYTGSTTDVVRRVIEHNTSSRGAKYTRGRRPVKLVYSAAYSSRALALREEARIKGLSRIDKVHLCSMHSRA
jgi:putative endonuclease